MLESNSAFQEHGRSMLEAGGVRPPGRYDRLPRTSSSAPSASGFRPPPAL